MLDIIVVCVLIIIFSLVILKMLPSSPNKDALRTLSPKTGENFKDYIPPKDAVETPKDAVMPPNQVAMEPDQWATAPDQVAIPPNETEIPSSCPATNLDSNGCPTSSCTLNGVNDDGTVKMYLMYQFTYYIECTIKLFMPYIDYNMLNNTVREITNKNIFECGIFEKSCILNVLTSMSISTYCNIVPDDKFKYILLYFFNMFTSILKDICNIFYDKDEFDNNNKLIIYCIYKNKTITDYKQLGTNERNPGNYGLILNMNDLVTTMGFRSTDKIFQTVDEFNICCNDLVKHSLIRNLKIPFSQNYDEKYITQLISKLGIPNHYTLPGRTNIFSGNSFTIDDNSKSQNVLINEELYENGSRSQITRIEDLFG